MLLTNAHMDRRCAGMALKTAPTPAHSAAEGTADDEGQDAGEAERQRLHVQHVVDPNAEPAEVPEVAHIDLTKRYGQAFDQPSGYPAPSPMGNWGQFRRGPLVSDHADYGAGYDPSPLHPHMFTTQMSVERTRPYPATPDGQSGYCAPEGA
jgi:hypothetical protein